MECLIIGRDLVRLLQNVARIPEMELLWRDLLHNPQVLSPQFTGKPHYPQSPGRLTEPGRSRCRCASEIGSKSQMCTFFRCSPAADGADLQKVPGLSSDSRHGDQAAVHDLQGNLSTSDL